MKLIRLEENLFAQLAKKRGYLVEEASREMVQSGIDLILKGIYRETNKEVTMRFAVKRRKKNKSSRYLDRWTWLEFNSSGGGDGWLYGLAHFIAFERSGDYIVVSRKALLSHVQKEGRIRWDQPFVPIPKEAKYKLYKNPKTLAVISQILSKEILKLEGAERWKKDG
jgi:hypothetical protein